MISIVGEALVWLRDENRVIPDLKAEPSRNEHRRHRRKYAEGELEEDRSFYFKGPGKPTKFESAESQYIRAACRGRG